MATNSKCPKLLPLYDGIVDRGMKKDRQETGWDRGE